MTAPLATFADPLVVTTQELTDISERSAIDNEKTEEGVPNAIGPFSSKITGLKTDKNYYVRAYATNAIETVYGEDQSFTTIDEASAPTATLVTPPAMSREMTYQLRISGSRVVQYRYSLDDSPWSESMDIDEALSFDLTAEGLHWLRVLGKDETGIWQARQSATTVTWTLDTTPPKVELPNVPTGTIRPFTADILVQGNDVVAYR
jgi:hypothetical protein